MRLLLIVFALLTAVFPAQATCFREASQEYGVSEQLLRAVVKVESGNRPDAINASHVQRTGTRDLGLTQINTSWLPRLKKYGITEQALLTDPCLNLKVGAWIMASTLDRVGNDWNGVGAYNAACTSLKGKDCEAARNRYAQKVYAAMRSREVGAPLTKPVPARVVIASLEVEAP